MMYAAFHMFESKTCLGLRVGACLLQRVLEWKYFAVVEANQKEGYGLLFACVIALFCLVGGDLLARYHKLWAKVS